MLAEAEMKANKDKLLDHLVDLQLRPVTNELHQIRYWSALDDPDEEKWDYTSHISRMDRKYPDRARRSDYDDDGARPGRSRLWLVAVLIVLVVSAASVAGYFVWGDYLAPGMSQTQGDSGYAPVQGYMVVLGNREIGIVSEADKATVESYVQQLTLQAQTQAGAEVVCEQALSFTPVTVDAIYVPNVNDVNAVLARHMVFVPVTSVG